MDFYISTLERTPERAIAGSMALYVSGIPRENIYLHLGRDGQDYDSPDDMCMAFIEAYPEMDGIQRIKAKDGTSHPMPRGNQGCLWSVLEILDRFLDSGAEIGYYNQDDMCGFSHTEKFDYYKDERPVLDLNLQVERLIEIDPDLMVFLVGYHRRIDPDYPRFDQELPIGKGMAGKGDSGVIFTRPGAEWCKNVIFKRQNALEHSMYAYGNDDHIYSTLTPNRFFTFHPKELVYPKEHYPNMTMEEERVRLNLEDKDKFNVPVRETINPGVYLS